MLSLFPTLLAFTLLVPFILRLTIGLYFLFSLKRLFVKEGRGTFVTYVLQTLSFLGSISLILGAYTQLGALLLALLSLILFYENKKDARHFFLFVMSFSLLFLGAGFFAFDLPI